LEVRIEGESWGQTGELGLKVRDGVEGERWAGGES
jgi:hypothetical protein